MCAILLHMCCWGQTWINCGQCLGHTCTWLVVLCLEAHLNTAGTGLLLSDTAMEMILRRLPITWVLLSIVYSVLANGYLEKDKERIRRQSSGSSAVSQICDIHLDGLYSHPSDCHKYVQCVSGTPWEMPCPGGLVFKPDKGWCETGPCQNSGSPGPLPVSSQSKPVYSQSSTYSTQRQSTDTKKDKKQTPPVTTRHYYNGQSPSTDQQATDTRQKTTTVEKRPVSRTQQFDAQEFCKSHQGTFAHPTCGKYVVCNGGYAWELTCSHGLVFKESTGSCDFGTCDPVGQSPNPDKESVQVTLPKESTNAQTTYRQETLSGSSDDGERKSDVPSIEEELPNAIQRAMKSLTQSLRREAQMARDIENNNRHQYRPFGVVQGFLRAKPFAKKLSLPAFVLCNASAYLISRFGIDNHESETYFRSIPSPIPENPYFLNPDDPYPTPEPGTCPWPRYTCPAQMEYRTFDGSCNNLQNPIIGRSFTPLKRLLYPDYGNGVGSPRLSRSRLKLPSPRKVSMALHPDQDVPNQIHTLMVMQFGQTLDHDLSLTAISKLAKDSSGRATETVNIECGSDGCDTSIPQCLPIPVPPNDKVFSNKKCLEFVRSEEVPGLDCGVGPRQQLNQITSFLDASNVYGSTKEEADTLRDISDPARGRLKITHNPNGGKYKPLLPETTDRTFCMDLDKKRHSCFRAGDERANEHAGLASMHTLWMREHNRIEQKLHEINPQWQGEKLYQETRKIIGAMMQHITYNEFLPVVMGTQKLAQYDLEVKKSGYYRGYNANVDPRISNAFATAAFRFGHTLIQPKLTRPRADFTKRPDGDMPLSKTFFRSDPVYDSKYDGVDGIMRGMCESSMQNFDRFVTKEVTEHLFSENPPDGPGTDLLSLNLQRGREHGIPGYNIWREFCGLGRASTFNDLANTIKKREIITKLEQTYDHVDDIDLFTGGLSEDNVEGGLIGPVFACIIGDQFRRLRQGDRFWYENKNPTHFTPGQLKELKKVTLARVLCNNLDQVVTMQPWVMMQPFRKTFPQKVYDQKSGLTIDWFNRLWDMDFNARVSCSSIDDVDLTKWKDKVYS